MIVLPRLCALALLLILVACKTTQTTVTDTSCTAFRKITYSASGDTAITVQQIREHNAAWDALCP